jgi:hypothetical protein
VLYDRGENEAALYHLDRSTPEDHWDELGIWRLIELKKSVYRLADDDAELKPWEARLSELSGEPDDIDEMLAEIEQAAEEARDAELRTQLELFAVQMADRHDGDESVGQGAGSHFVITSDGQEYDGSWDDIVSHMRDASTEFADRSVTDYMAAESRRHFRSTGIRISATNAEAFVRGSADAGLLRIVR